MIASQHPGIPKLGMYSSGRTHVITIPGTSYVCVLDDAYMQPIKGKAPRVEALMKSLSRTTVKGIGKRRVKAQPVLQTIEEFQALTTAEAA